jgi:hypothetical protein
LYGEFRKASIMRDVAPAALDGLVSIMTIGKHAALIDKEARRAL